MLIAMSGADYSGKSTQIEILNTDLDSVIIWSRFGYTPLILKIKNFIRKRSSNQIDVVSGAENLKVHKIGKICDLWFWSGLLDYILFGVYLRYACLSKKDIICDRYILDVLVDLSTRYSPVDWRVQFTLVIYKLIFPKPQKYLYLNIDLNSARKRREIKVDPFHVSDSDFLKLKMYYNHFLEKFGIFNVIEIDASHDPFTVATMVASKVTVET